jgi:hypothetical protein
VRLDGEVGGLAIRIEDSLSPIRWIDGRYQVAIGHKFSPSVVDAARVKKRSGIGGENFSLSTELR